MSVTTAHAPVVLERASRDFVDAARKPAQPQDCPSRRPSLGSRSRDPGGADTVSRRQPGELEELLRRLGSWPYLRTELRGARMTLRVRSGDVVIGTLNLETRALTASVPPGMVSLLLANRPQLRGTKDGVSVHVTDVDNRRAAEALLRWRIELERFAPQLHCASP
jgi:hypothetical protein